MRNLLTVATLLFVALSMGMAQAHALELPPKMEYDASMYLRLHRTLYRLFGPPLGAGIEALAVLLSIILAVIVRNEPGSAWLAAGGAAAMVIAHVIWWIWVNPANRALAQMPLASPPPGLDGTAKSVGVHPLGALLPATDRFRCAAPLLLAKRLDLSAPLRAALRPRSQRTKLQTDLRRDEGTK
jgi:hypothetical protein